MSSFESNGTKENGVLCATTLGLLRKRKATELSSSDLYSLGPKKRPARTDPLVHHGRHFGHTVRAFCRIHSLIKLSLSIAVQLDLEEMEEQSLQEDEFKEYLIYKQLLALSPKLEEHLFTGSEEEIYYIGDMITKGSSNARSNDTRALKSAVVDWITLCGGVLVPPLQHNIKTDRGFHHYRTGELLCPVTMNWDDLGAQEKLRSGELAPAGDHWSIFLYLNHKYNPEDPWQGLLHGLILVNAYKFVFTSPSSVERPDNRATRCSNSKLHGMACVTIPSLAYIATQVRFALSSIAVFSRTDGVTDSETFYNSIIILLEDPEEHNEVNRLLKWWNSQIFPQAALGHSVVTSGDTVHAKIKEKRRREREAATDELRMLQIAGETPSTVSQAGASQNQ
ncbi:hypothetical protein BKA70DRAFT_1452313 [Coprinopsis sp. MPI-PUGE-AT-0042]|nr:hypothetical protein BKA70DRAFT_1452313 [Coprinopsis sp. MPI-PUGE-AT-0042]